MADTNSVPEYQFQCAISILAQDESLANELREMLEPRIGTFVYSKKQEQLAGRDGDEVFREIFLKKARIVVVLFRSGWGETRFTRIEQEAIRDRAHDEGWGFTLFAALEESPAMPKWLSGRKLYYGLPRFGLPGLAGAIENLVGEAGGDTKPETPEDRAAAADREIQFAAKRRAFLRSEAGVKAADKEFEEIGVRLIERANQIAERNQNLPLKPTLRRTVSGFPSVCILGPMRSLSLEWERHFANDLDESSLSVSIWKGPPALYGQMFYEEPRRIEKFEFQFDLDRSMAMQVKHPQRTSPLAREEFVGLCLDYLIQAALEAQRERDH